MLRKFYACSLVTNGIVFFLRVKVFTERFFPILIADAGGQTLRNKTKSSTFFRLFYGELTVFILQTLSKLKKMK